MAASKKTAALGKVSCETAWNDACRPFVFAAQSDSRYSPNAATDPENTQVIMPGMIPLDAIACAKISTGKGTSHAMCSGHAPGGRSAFLRQDKALCQRRHTHEARGRKQQQYAPLPIIVFDKLLMQLTMVACPSGVLSGAAARPPRSARDSSPSAALLGSAEPSAATPYVCVISYESSSSSSSYSLLACLSL